MDSLISSMPLFIPLSFEANLRHIQFIPKYFKKYLKNREGYVSFIKHGAIITL